MSPAESLLCFAEQPQGWGDPLFPLCAPANPPGTGLCAALAAKLLVAVLLPACFLEIKKCEISTLSQDAWQFSCCFGHQGSGLWTGTTTTFDGGCLRCRIKLFIFHFTAPCCFFFPMAATGSCSVRWGVCTLGKFTLYMRWKMKLNFPSLSSWSLILISLV